MSNQNQTISWSAPEFRLYEKNAAWYVTLCVLAALIIIFFLFEKEIFSAVTVLILTAAVAYFANQQPNIITVELSSRAIHFGKIVFPYKQLRHFWIVNTEHHRTLNIETNTLVNNIIIVEIMDQNEETIRRFLLQYLPEHHLTTETFAQKISHHLKF